MLRMCRHLLQAGLAWILYVTLGSPLLAAEVVLVNRPESPDDRRYEYPETLLQAILDRTAPEYGPARVERAAQVMSRERIFAALKHTGNQLHVLAEAPKPGWEEALIPIRIPIRKGIQGYRVFLIKRAHQPLLEKVHSLEALAALPTGSGAQWSTAPVMTAAGFNVVLGSSYEGLFGMLNQERFVTFGRGINEAFREQRAMASQYPDIVVDANVLLYIPLPTYFFVTPHRPDLARRIETGLRAMQHDGSFDTLFYTHHAEDLLRARLSERRIFRIPNPNLSPQTPLQDASLWFDIERDLPTLKAFVRGEDERLTMSEGDESASRRVE